MKKGKVLHNRGPPLRGGAVGAGCRKKVKKVVELSRRKKHTYLVRSVILIHTGLAVDPCGVLPAVDTNAPSNVLPSPVQTSLLLCDVLVIVTVFGFIVTVAF